MKRFLSFFLFPMVLLAANSIYLRAPKVFLTENFVKRSQWNRDHVHDSDYGFGYLTESSYNQLSGAEKNFLLPVNEELLRHHAFDPKTLSILDLDKKPGSIKEDYHTYESLTS